MAKKINVYIITGFLGSGKTTLLNNLLAQFSNMKNVVIENEFGKINIDSKLISIKNDSIFELTNGCICCSINNKLASTLTAISALEEKPQNLFIETTGIADVGEVASIFNQAYSSNFFELKKIICVVDSVNIQFYDASNIEIHKQIVASDIIMINKLSLVSKDEILKIEALINTINPFANITFSQNGSLDISTLSSVNKTRTNLSEKTKKEENVHKIKSLLFETEDFFDIQNLNYELFKTLFLYYHQIFRVKGYVLNTEKKVYLVQSVGKTTTITPVDYVNIEKSQLVFIGKELQLKTIERILKSAIVTNKKMQLS